MNAIMFQVQGTVMKAIEFQSHLVDGKILVPAECGLQEGQDIKGIQGGSQFNRGLRGYRE
jgi:hypothetical protein